VPDAFARAEVETGVAGEAAAAVLAICCRVRGSGTNQTGLAAAKSRFLYAMAGADVFIGPAVTLMTVATMMLVGVVIIAFLGLQPSVEALDNRMRICPVTSNQPKHEEDPGAWRECIQDCLG